MIAYIPQNTSSKREPPKDGKYLAPGIVIDAVEKHFEITVKELMGKSRKREVCYPRQIAMYLLAHYTRLSLNSIAVIFENKDHTTVIHSMEAIDNYMFQDERAKEQVEQIISTFSK